MSCRQYCSVVSSNLRSGTQFDELKMVVRIQLTLLAVSPFLAIRSAPTTARGTYFNIEFFKIIRSRTHVPTAAISWCWNNEPTILSQSMVDGTFSDRSSNAVSLFSLSIPKANNLSRLTWTLDGRESIV